MHGFEDVSDAPNGDDVLASWKERFGTDGRLTLYRGVGCNQCDNTGYRGRAGIHELLHVTRGLRQLIQERARSDAIQRKALSEGLRTLRQDGLEKVLAGITSLEEVRANSY